MRFYYVPRTRWLWLETIWPPSYLWTYQVQWQRAAYRLAAQLHGEVEFDLAHQLTYVGFRNPGYLWKLEMPLVWGPIGGLENTPWRWLPALGWHGAVYYAGRNVVNAVHKRLLASPRRAFRKARGGIIAATEGIRREILRCYGEQSEVISEIGPPHVTPGVPLPRRPGEPLRLAWSGHHEAGKALPLLLQAVAKLPSELPWSLDILGRGPCMKSWQRLSGRLGLDGRCRWHGWLARGEAVSIVRRSHVFVITSMKDLTSTVLLEALAQGVPVICPDHCGFSNVVNDDCGIKVPIRHPRQFQGDLGRAVLRLADDEPERLRLAAGALRRIGEFSWERKAAMVDKIYRRVTTRTTAEGSEVPPACAKTYH